MIGEEAEVAADLPEEVERAEAAAAAELSDDDDDDDDGEGWSDEEDEGSEDEDGVGRNDAGGPVLVLPLYSMLSASEQMRVWAPTPPGTGPCAGSA